jgi:hypothetical protein
MIVPIVRYVLLVRYNTQEGNFTQIFGYNLLFYCNTGQGTVICQLTHTRLSSSIIRWSVTIVQRQGSMLPN